MDTSAWKLNDPSWMSLREKQWPALLGILKKNLVDCFDPDAYISKAHLYYLAGDLVDVAASPVLATLDLFALHPQLDIKAAREIISISERFGGGTRSAFSGWYSYPLDLYAYFKAGVLEPSIGEIIIEAYYGVTYADSVVLRGIASDEKVDIVINDLLRSLGVWLMPDDKYEWFPAHRLIPFLIGALERLEFARYDDVEFFLSSFSRRVKRASSASEFPLCVSFCEQFKSAIGQSKVDGRIKSLYRN
jgi:hypothetical protein